MFTRVFGAHTTSCKSHYFGSVCIFCPLQHVCVVCEFEYERDEERDTHVKQKKRLVDPTRKVVAADTGTYRLGRNGRVGAEAGTPTPPPTPPLLKPGIRDGKRGEGRKKETRVSTGYLL